MSHLRHCGRCGRMKQPDAPDGLCPACLIAMNLREATGEPGAGSRAAPLAAEAIAPLFPEWEILSLLGAGGMGSVYRARQPRLDRLVALKVLAHDPEDAGFVERFTREARTLARLSHPNIVAIHDFGEREGLFFLVMELVDGVTLRHLLQLGRMEPAQALVIVPPICDALQYAHERGVIHRDIKPENILIDQEGRVKVADFGIARLAGVGVTMGLTADNQVLGTVHYMAPEQLEQPGAVDHRADIYALGVVFYEMLTGELPLGRFPEPSKKVCIDVRLDEVVLKALEKEPDRRYQQASEVKTNMEAANRRPEAGRPDTRRWPLAATGAGVLLLTVFLALYQIGVFRSGDDPSFDQTAADATAPESEAALSSAADSIEPIPPALNPLHERLLAEQAELRRLEFRAEAGRLSPVDLLQARLAVARAAFDLADAANNAAQLSDALREILHIREKQLRRTETLYRSGRLSDEELLVAQNAWLDARMEKARQGEPVAAEDLPASLALMVEFEAETPETVVFELRGGTGNRSAVPFRTIVPGGEPLIRNLRAVPDGDYYLHVFAPGYSRQFLQLAVEGGNSTFGSLSPQVEGHYSIQLWKTRYLVLSYFVTYEKTPNFDGPAVDFHRIAVAQSGSPPVLRGDFGVWQGTHETRTYGPHPFLSRHRFGRNFGHVVIGGREEFETMTVFDPDREWISGQIPGTAERAYLVKIHGNSPGENSFVKLLVEGVYDEAPEGVEVSSDPNRL